MSTAVYKNTGHSNTFTRLFQALLGRCLNYWLQGPNMHGASNDHKDLSNGAQSVERRGLWVTRSWEWISQPSQKWHWMVTLVVASPYQGVKLDQALAWEFRVDSEDHYAQARAEQRQWWSHPGFEAHGHSQLKSKTGSTSGPTKWWLVTAKNFKKKKMYLMGDLGTSNINHTQLIHNFTNYRNTTLRWWQSSVSSSGRWISSLSWRTWRGYWMR